MNKNRRERITNIQNNLSKIRNEIDFIKDEECDCYSNLPENLQESDRGISMEDAIDYIDDALTDLDEVVENLEKSKVWM